MTSVENLEDLIHLSLILMILFGYFINRFLMIRPPIIL